MRCAAQAWIWSMLWPMVDVRVFVSQKRGPGVSRRRSAGQCILFGSASDSEPRTSRATHRALNDSVWRLRSMLPLPTTVLVSLLGWAAACGGSGAREGAARPTEVIGESGDPTAIREARPGSDTQSAEGVPLPELPSSAPVSSVERTAPTITSLEDAAKALDEGYYEAVEAALPRLSGGAPVKLLNARLQWVTGRYADAERLATEAARDAATRPQALAVAAEIQMAQGKLSESLSTLQPLDADPDAHRAHVLLGQLLARQGREAEADLQFRKVIAAFQRGSIGDDEPEELTMAALAAWGLGSTRSANDGFVQASQAFERAGRKDGAFVAMQLAWAQVFLRKYDAGHAEESVRDALAINPNHPVGHALMARIRIAQSFDFAAAAEHTERALQTNPRLVLAHVTNAGMALQDNDITGALEHIQRALSVDAKDLEALSVKAAIHYLADDEAAFRQAKRDVFAIHRTYSEMYTTIADFAEWEHRYPDIVQMGREAVALRSDDALAHATLGLNLLRTGDEEQGLESLRSAWRRDRYNVRVFNTLNLYDEIIPRYETFASGPFIFRMHRDEKPVLERYVPQTLQRAYTDMVRRYGFTPEGPVRIELYADASHFAMRTTGLPSLGVQGVCFGKVVTAISPQGGPFNWGQIDWHELAHVFHIQLSDNHVPRWFTEGLAEYETNIARPEWKREMDHHLWAALSEERLPPLRLMNRAFTRARSAMDMMVAYYASTRVVTYIADKHGFPKLVQMLRAWGRGKTSAEVIQSALGIDVDALDQAFRAHERQRLSARANDFAVTFEQYTELEPLERAAAAAPTDAATQGALAAGLLVAGKAEEARTQAAKAVELDTHQPVARMVLARLALMEQDGATAQTHLRALLAGNRDGYDIRLLMARAALGQNDTAGAKSALEAAVRIDAERPEGWQGLVKVAELTHDAALELRALERLARLDEHDRDTNKTLLKALVEAERWNDAIAIGEMSIFVNPHDAEVHGLLAQAYVKQRRPRDALYEADTALIAEHPAPARMHLLRASAWMQAGDRSKAREAARAAETADPSTAEAARSIVGG